MSKPLKCFYAVTQTSLYVAGYFEGQVVIIKLAIRKGSHSDVAVSERMTGSQLLLSNSLHLFDYSVKEPIINRYGAFWFTSHIKALFTNKREAEACLKKDPASRDQNCINQTHRVLGLIGDHHPVFKIDREEKDTIAQRVN